MDYFCLNGPDSTLKSLRVTVMSKPQHHHPKNQALSIQPPTYIGGGKLKSHHFKVFWLFCDYKEDLFFFGLVGCASSLEGDHYVQTPTPQPHKQTLSTPPPTTPYTEEYPTLLQ